MLLFGEAPSQSMHAQCPYAHIPLVVDSMFPLSDNSQSGFELASVGARSIVQGVCQSR